MRFFAISALALSVFCSFPASVFAAADPTLIDVSHGGVTIHDGDTVSRASLTDSAPYWTFHLDWPVGVPGYRGLLAVFRGTFGHVENPQNGVTWGTSGHFFGNGDGSVMVPISLPVLGDRATASSAYTAVAAEVVDFQGFVDWFVSGGSAGVAPVSSASISFSYDAADHPVEIRSAVSSVSYRGVTVAEGDPMYRNDLLPLDPSGLDSYWDFRFSWPVNVPNTRGMIMVFRGTFGDVEGGDLKNGTNYAVAFQMWGSENDIVRSLNLPALRNASTTPSTYTVMVAERMPTYAQQGGTDPAEAEWFASGGTQGVPPLKYTFFTFEFKGDKPLPQKKGVTAPVIIIPGILGSQKVHGRWVIDPLLHTYDDLIDTLLANGYERDVTLFTYAYQWRNSNTESAYNLKDKIDSVKEICGCEKVDIVAHSMGGLVARSYIEGTHYGDDVRRLIFLGTPHLGAPKDYLPWEGGDIGDDFLSNMLELVFTGEALEHGYANLYDYIRQAPIYSVKQLLPVYDYLKNADGSARPGYPDTYPDNQYLEKLDAPENVQKLYDAGVSITNIIGDTGAASTVSAIRTVPSPIEGRWIDGYPQGYADSGSDRGLELGAGDGTVPASSAGFFASSTQTVAAEHMYLPTEAASTTFAALTLQSPQTVVRRSLISRILFVRDFSPVDFMVTAPDGKRLGIDFASGTEVNEIPGAFYSGNDADDEFAIIPEPMSGEYVITTKGTGSGSYQVEAAYMDAATTTARFFGGVATSSTEDRALILGASSAEPLAFAPADPEDGNATSTPQDDPGETDDQDSGDTDVPPDTPEPPAAPTPIPNPGGGGGPIFQPQMPASSEVARASSTPEVPVAAVVPAPTPAVSAGVGASPEENLEVTPPEALIHATGIFEPASNQLAAADAALPAGWYDTFVGLLKELFAFIRHLFIRSG